MNRNAPIGIFDSGLGGLTVLKELEKLLPNEEFLYFGDTARVPYGNKSPDVVSRYSHEISNFLLSHEIKLLVIACNTASAYAAAELKKSLPIPVIDVVSAGVHAVTSTNSKKIGIIGTQGTIQSAVYPSQLLKENNSLLTYSVACPLFVPLVEEGWTEELVTYQIIEKYLSQLKKWEPDSLLLGCTHYPLLKKALCHFFPENVICIDSALYCAKAVESALKDNFLLNMTGENKENHFFVSDAPELFKKNGSRFLEYKMPGVEVLSLT